MYFLNITFYNLFEVKRDVCVLTFFFFGKNFIFCMELKFLFLSSFLHDVSANTIKFDARVFV